MRIDEVNSFIVREKRWGSYDPHVEAEIIVTVFNATDMPLIRKRVKAYLKAQIIEVDGDYQEYDIHNWLDSILFELKGDGLLSTYEYEEGDVIEWG